MKSKVKLTQNKGGYTFIELIFYMGLFMIITPILLSVAVNSFQSGRNQSEESKVNSDGQFISGRIYDLITDAKYIDLSRSRLNDSDGMLTLVMQDDSEVVIEKVDGSEVIEITEEGITAALSSSDNQVSQLYFERIPDQLNDPEIVLGVNVRLRLSGESESDVDQSYILSANLARPDYDNDQCPDQQDRFPRHSQCCGDGDDDGMCDELDNCILEFNPFQEDYDDDGVGDSCDFSAFVEGGNSENTQNFGAFACNSERQLLDLIYQDPPLSSAELKNILMGASPLSPAVLAALVDVHPLLKNGHFQQIFTNNVLIPEDIYNDVLNLSLPNGILNVITNAQNGALESPYSMIHNDVTHYDINFTTEIVGEEESQQEWINEINFFNPDFPLCYEGNTGKTDVFLLDVINGTGSIDVTTNTTQGSETVTLTTSNNQIVNSQGFSIEFNEKVGNAHVLLISSEGCNYQLDSMQVYFGAGAEILNPPPTDTGYDAIRYTSYCEGGCTTGCGDVGTGIRALDSLSDTCYKQDLTYPEWCSFWYTFENDDTDHPAFIGGTQTEEETVYWEKTFKTVVNELQLENLQSITVTGEIAYQSITQFFCDLLASSCPINGILVDSQNVELYNFATESWEVIGTIQADGTSSDQQAFEIIYNLPDVGDFVGGEGNEQIMARMEFHWDGEPLPEEENAPSFMLIDYFTVHLKW